MKKFKMILFSVLGVFGLLAGLKAQDKPGNFFLDPIQSIAIPVTTTKITSIVFPVSIRPAGKGTRDVLAEKVKGTDNVLILKAAHIGFVPTNVTVIGMNGKVYSLNLHYEAEPSICNFRVVEDTAGYAVVSERSPHIVLLSGLPVDESTLSEDADTIKNVRQFLNLAVGSDRLHLALKSIYIKDRLLWFALEVRNYSQLDFPAEFEHFSVQDKRRAKRTAVQERFLKPVYANSDRIIPGNSSKLVVFGFDPFTVPTNKKLIIQMADRDGGRVLTLRVKAKHILRVRRLQQKTIG
jgi:conjugative transposon TraN protein